MCPFPQGTNVIADSLVAGWSGTARPIKNTGEICAFYHTQKWILDYYNEPGSERDTLNIITDSKICACDTSWMTRTNLAVT